MLLDWYMRTLKMIEKEMIPRCYQCTVCPSKYANIISFRRGRQIVSFRFEYRLPVPEHRNYKKKPCISPEPGANAKRLWGRVGYMLADHRDGLSSSSFAWSSIAQSVCQRAFSLLAIWCLRPWWVRILPSAEEDNLSPFDSNIACLCQSIEINRNKHDRKGNDP